MAEHHQEHGERQHLQHSYKFETLMMELATTKSSNQLLQEQIKKKNGEIRCGVLNSSGYLWLSLAIFVFW